MPPQLFIGIEDVKSFKNTYDASSSHIYSHQDILAKFSQNTLSENDIHRLRTQIQHELEHENFKPVVMSELAKSYYVLCMIEAGELVRPDYLQALQADVSGRLATLDTEGCKDEGSKLLANRNTL